MIALDTNVLVRYLAQDDEPQTAVATALIETRLSAEQPGYVSALVFAELHCVLTRLYGIDRQRFADIARGLLMARALRFENLQAGWNALQAFEDGLYLVVIDDVEYRDLEKQVFLKDDSRITFIRLTMLTGG